VMVPSPGSGIPGAPADWYVLKMLNFCGQSNSKKLIQSKPSLCQKSLALNSSLLQIDLG
jgi:hypothetical protein